MDTNGLELPSDIESENQKSDERGRRRLGEWVGGRRKGG